jgi:hypothetical protein
MNGIPERDWKYLRSIYDEMLNELSLRINQEVLKIITREGISESEKRLKVYDVVMKRDRIVGDCFDDWRRSTIFERCWALRKHGLLKAEHLAHLDPQTQMWIDPPPMPDLKRSK